MGYHVPPLPPLPVDAGPEDPWLGQRDAAAARREGQDAVLGQAGHDPVSDIGVLTCLYICP